MKILTEIPLRSDGVRGTLEFVFSVHPSSSSKPSDETTPQKRGANITQEALAVATRILTSPPESVSSQTWFDKVAPQLFYLLDSHEGPELVRAASQIITFGVLGRRKYGAPGMSPLKWFLNSLWYLTLSQALPGGMPSLNPSSAI